MMKRWINWMDGVHTRLTRAIVQRIDDRATGWIGNVPFVFLLQLFTSLAIPLRFFVSNSATPTVRVELPTLLMLVGTGASLALTVLERGREKTDTRHRHWHYLILLVDVLAISKVYLNTGNVRSDVYLLYFLPFLYAGEYFGIYVLIMMFLLISFSFGSVLYEFPRLDQVIHIMVVGRRERTIVFLIREIFFFAVLATGALLIALTRLERKIRLHQVDAMFRFKEEVDQLSDLEAIFTTTANAAQSLLNVDGADRLSVVLSNDGTTVPQQLVPSGVIDIVMKRCLRSGSALHLPLFSGDPHARSAEYGKLRSLIAAPLIAQSGIKECILVANSHQGSLRGDSLLVLQNLTALAATAIDRADALRTFRQLSSETSRAPLQRDVVLESLLDEVMAYGFDFVGVSVVERYLGTIVMVRGRNIPNGWLKRSRYSLSSNDILAWVVKTRMAEVIEQPDQRINRTLWDRFGHDRFIRVYLPVVWTGEVVAVIQAGCDKTRQDKVFTQDNLRLLKETADRSASELASIRPFVLFEKIATGALDLIAADSAQIRVYRDGALETQAWAGKQDADLIEALSRSRADMSGALAPMPAQGLQVIDDEVSLRTRFPYLYNCGFRAVLSLPLDLGPDLEAVLCLCYCDTQRKFTKKTIELQRIFTGLMEVAIRGNLLLDAVSSLAEQTASLARFQKLIESLAENTDPTRVLGEIVQNLLFVLDAELITLHEFVDENKQFLTPPTRAGKFNDPARVDRPVERASFFWELLRGRADHDFVEDVRERAVLSASSTEHLRFIDVEQICSCAWSILRAPDTAEVIGILFVNYRDPHRFQEQEKQSIRALAASAAIAIRTARSNLRTARELTEKRRELEALQTIDEAIASSDKDGDLQGILRIILEQAMSITRAPVGVIFWLSSRSVLLPAVKIGVPDDADLRYLSREGIVGLAATTQETQIALDIFEERWSGIYRELAPNTRAELATPIIDNGKILGVLNLEHPTPSAFRHEHRTLAQTWAVQCVLASRYSHLRNEVNNQDRPLRALREMAKAVQGHGTESAVRIVLTGITANQGMGFTRAMVFLRTENKLGLLGKMAVGPLSREEAAETWSALSGIETTMGDHDEALRDLISRAITCSRAIQAGTQPHPALNRLVRQACLVTTTLDGALKDAFKGGRLKVVHAGTSDAAREILHSMVQDCTLTSTFVCVPIKGRAGILGVLIVDLEYQEKDRQVGYLETRFLEAFAELLADIFEKAEQSVQLTDEEKQAAWNDAIADVYHDLGTGMAIVGGRLDQLRSILAMGISQAPYRLPLENLEYSLDFLRKTFEDIRNYSSPDRYRFEPCDLGSILQKAISDACSVYSVKVKVLPSLIVDTILADRFRLGHAFVQLIKNSHEASRPEQQSVVAVNIRMNYDPKAPDAMVQIDFTDDGLGIDDNLKEEIFERLVSTKGRDGRGRGLSIVRDVIRMHGGTIIEKGKLGAHFVIRLPLNRSVWSIPKEL